MSGHYLSQATSPSLAILAPLQIFQMCLPFLPLCVSSIGCFLKHPPSVPTQHCPKQLLKNLLPSHHHLYQGDQNMAFNAVPKLLQPPFSSSSAAPSPCICHFPHLFHKSSLTHPGKSDYPLLYAIIGVLQSCVHFSSSSCGVTLSRASASFICVLTVPKEVIQVEMSER